MITEHDLQEAIAECQGQRNPNAQTCIKLAAFLTIQKEMFGKDEPIVMPTYSYDMGGDLTYDGESEFARLIHGRRQEDILPVMDELMEAIQVLNPRLYDSVIRKLQ